MNIEKIVINKLEPSFHDMLLTESDRYWESYTQTLTTLGAGVFDEYFIKEVNMGMTSSCNRGVFDACTDVATTLESLAPAKYAGKFRY